MGRRILAFFLGTIFGVIFFFGAIAGALIGLAVIPKTGQFIPGGGEFLGDLANMSVYEIAESVSKLYKDKVGVQDENGNYFTLGQFCEYYNIDPSQLFGGKQVRSEILEIPIFDLFAEDGGTNKLKVSVIPALVNMFVDNGTDEEGNPIPFFSEELMNKLSAHTIAELMGENGIATVFEEVRIAEVAMGMLPLEQTEDNALMWAVGQAKLGALIGGGLNGNILREFKEGGAFDELGKMPIVAMLGDSSQYLNAFIGNNAIADMIDDEGNLNPDDIINGVYLGDIVSLHRKEINDLADYDNTEYQNDNLTLYRNDDGDYALVNTDGVAFEARFNCNIEEHTHTAECGDPDNYTCGKTEHTHDIDCYGFAWYDAEDNAASGIYGAIADVTVGMLTSGDQDALMSKFTNIPIRDLLGDSVEISGLLENFVDYTIGDLMGGEVFDGLYLGQLLALSRTEVTNPEDYTPIPETNVRKASDEYIKLDGDVWYKAKLTCTIDEQEHVHNDDCFGYEWKTELGEDASGIYAALADITVGMLMGGDSDVLMDKLTNIPLRELLAGQEMSGVFESIADMTIGELINGGIDNMYIGQLMGFSLEEIAKPDGDVVPLYKTEPHDDGDKVAKYVILSGEGEVLGLSMDGKTWYKGKVTCTKQHAHTEDCGDAPDYTCGKEEHEHNVAGCYGFVWENGDDEVKDLTEVLANKQINDLTDINGVINDLTLSQVMGGEENIPSQLRALKDTTVGNLASAVEQLRVGDMLGYTQTDDGWNDAAGEPVTGVMAKLADNTVADLGTLDVMDFTLGEVMGDAIPSQLKGLENAKLNEMEQAINDLYLGVMLGYTQGDGTDGDYVWTKEDGSVVDGMMAKLANKKVSELGDLNETIQTFTLSDVLGDSVPSMLASIKDTQIKDLDSAIDNMYLGDLLQYTKGDGVEGNFEWSKDGTEVVGMMAKLANKKVSELGDLDKTIQTFTMRDVLGENIPSPLASLADTPLGELSGAIDQMYLGNLLQFKRRPVFEADYTTDVVSDLIKSKNTDGSVEYALNDGGVWYEALLTCTKTEHKHDPAICHGSTDEEADCGKLAHTHGAECFIVLWYQECTDAHSHDGEWSEEGKSYVPANNLLGRMAHLKISELDSKGITSVVYDTELGEVLELDNNSNPLLRELGAIKIGELNGELDGIEVGVAMGFQRKEVDRQAKEQEQSAQWEHKFTDMDTKHHRDEVFKDKDGNWYIYDIKHGIYFEAQLICDKPNEHSGEEMHTFECFGYVWYDCKDYGTTDLGEHVHGVPGEHPCTRVKGLNEKMSNLRIDELNADKMTTLATNLTMGDLIDSEMIKLEEKDICLLSILFDKSEDGCTPVNYMIKGNNDPVTYWKSKHDSQSPSEEHGLEWKQMKLGDFISTLIDTLSNIQVTSADLLG